MISISRLPRNFNDFVTLGDDDSLKMQTSLQPIALKPLQQPSPPARPQATKSAPVDSVDFQSAAPPSESLTLRQTLRAALTCCMLGAGTLLTGSTALASPPEIAIQAPQTLELQETRIDPSVTDPAITQARGPHLAIVDTAAQPNGLLLLSLGGTNSVPSDFLAFDRLAAGQGYSVLALDYPNTVITTACKTSPQPDPCTLFRREIVSGEQVSDLVQVDRDNSIEHRLEALLRYQAKVDPQHYGQFVNEEGPVWNKIVVVGHSQGSGHAGFLAKKHPMQGAILLAGPQDTTDAGPASWMGAPGATPRDHFFSFLHKGDFFDSNSQLGAVRIIRGEPGTTPALVDHQAPNSPIIMTDAPVRDPHMSVIGAEFSDIWASLLQQAAQ